MRPCKLQSVQSCIENFYCSIVGTKKEITGYRYWGSGTPKFFTGGGLKVAQIAFFLQNCSLSTGVAFLVFDSIFLLPVWRKLHVGHPFLLVKHASHFYTLFQPSRWSANVSYHYFRISRYRALTQRLRSRRVCRNVLRYIITISCTVIVSLCEIRRVTAVKTELDIYSIQ